MRRDSTSFGWGSLIRSIQRNDANTLRNVLKDHKIITEAQIKKQAYKTWGNHAAEFGTLVPEGFVLENLDPANEAARRPMFYRFVKSRMIAKRIVGHLKTAEYEFKKNSLNSTHGPMMTKKRWIKPTILWLLLQSCYPPTREGVLELNTDIRNARLSLGPFQCSTDRT